MGIKTYSDDNFGFMQFSGLKEPLKQERLKTPSGGQRASALSEPIAPALLLC
jgi:hypothetical protein